MKATPSTRTHPLSACAAPFLAAAVLMLAPDNCGPVFSAAKGKTSNMTWAKTTRIVNGEFDAGLEVKVTVTNVGEEGFLYIRSECTTSEGEWSRKQDLLFDKGETRALTYFLHEPTINAENIECRVGVRPKAD
ncbi:MAG: hypothetical protein LC795_16855 [Acidobacteria bacterium]|nr:hypothetical protein [Acidobacteriota bacterium]